MWRLVSEGFRVYRWILLVTWSSAVVGIALVFSILAWAGIVPAHRAVLWAVNALPLYLLLASAIPGWIALGTELTEKRILLQLLLPIPLREVALARVLLPTAFLLAGLPLAHLARALGAFAHEHPAPWLGHPSLELIAAFLLFLHQISLAVAEVTALKETSRWKAFLGWLLAIAAFLGAVVAAQLAESVLARAAAVTGVSVIVAAATVALFCRRPRY